MHNTLFIGIDLHKSQFTTCFLYGGKFSHEGLRFSTNHNGYNSFIQTVHDHSHAIGANLVRLAIESTGNSRHFRDLMESHGFEVIVVNTLRFKVVNQSTKKTDKNDARTLCEFLSKDILPQSHLCSSKSEAIRRILKSRSLLVENSVALKNQAHATLLAYGIHTKPAQFQSMKERKLLLLTLEMDIAEVISPIFETLETIEKQRKALEKNLSQITSNDSYVKLLLTIPGVGIVNACTIRAYIDEISRFPSYKHFSAYCGLVPWVQNSNETVHYGKITKYGPPELRTALVQCVVAMVRMSDRTGTYSIMRQYQQLKDEKSSGKAIIATARKLSRIIYIMLTTGERFNEAKLMHSDLPI